MLTRSSYDGFEQNVEEAGDPLTIHKLHKEQLKFDNPVYLKFSILNLSKKFLPNFLEFNL